MNSGSDTQRSASIRPKRTWRRRILHRAFSLIELIVVILLLGIVAAIGSVRYSHALSHHRALRRAEQVAAHIQRARHAARGRSQIVSLSFDAANESYTMTGLPHPDHPSGTFVVDLAEGPLAAELSTADFGGDAILSFNSFGVPDSGGSLTIASGSAVQTVIVVAGSGAVTIP